MNMEGLTAPSFFFLNSSVKRHNISLHKETLISLGRLFSGRLSRNKNECTGET